MKITVTGASGFLGRYVAEAAASMGEVVALFHASPPEKRVAPGIEWKKTDIADEKSVHSAIAQARPEIIIHCAAMTRIADCESSPDAAHNVNVRGTAHVASAAVKHGAYLISLSTDMVFDGEKAPYSEDAEPKPLSVYGRTKLESEKLCPPSGLVLRLSLSYGRSLDPERPTFFENALRNISAGKQATFFRDEWRTPLWAGDFAKIVPLLIDKRPSGILHLGGPERMTRLEMAIRACKKLGMEADRIISGSIAGLPGPPRPRDLSLDVSKFKSMFPSFEFTCFEDSISLDFPR